MTIFELLDTLRRAGIRRNSEFIARTDSAKHDMGDALIFEDAEGTRAVGVPPTFWSSGGGESAIT